MNFFQNMRIGRGMGLGLAVLCFLLVVNVGFAWNAISTVGAQLDKSDRAASGQKPADIAGTVHAAKRGVFLVALATLALAAGFGYLFARSIALPIGEALRVAEALAAGDLSGDIRPRGTGETAQLLRALQAIQAELVAIVAEVRDGTGAIASASERISRGNADLSRRSDQHASSLEQTASSMEQLAATVKQNADNAHQAHLLVESAHGRAAGAAEAVSRMVGAMDEVASSSREIAQIVGVIDGIAFQTNLLALNAAVEAARAGEKGRGFAVVAAEVRSLAGRSAQAAKEIKGLVQTSLRAAQEGESAVEQCGEALAELHGEIKNVKTIAGEIAVASREQSSGIEQVNNAVMNMDEMIQRNAALEARSVADAEALDERTQALARAVAKFTLGRAADMPARPQTQEFAAPATHPRLFS